MLVLVLVDDRQVPSESVGGRNCIFMPAKASQARGPALAADCVIVSASLMADL